MTETVAQAQEPTWFGQPRGLTVLFLTEMWEKFSFYGMRTLLVYYMTKQLLMAQEHASLVYGAYTAAVYLTPIFGGVLSDRWLGRRRSVILGGTIMAIGHFLLAFEVAFYPALAVIALGNGLFLPSLPSQIAGLFREGDPRRASAYNIYYVGINLGAFLAPLVCGTIGELLGWHWGFAAAGVGMVSGLALYVFGQRHLPPDPVREPLRPISLDGGDWFGRVVLLSGIAAAVVVFRGAYEQTGNTVALWADTGVDRALGSGWSIPMTWFQSFNPMLVFLFTPFLVAFWTRRARKGREPSALVKMSLGAAIVALAFLLLAGAAAGEGRASWLWLAAFFAVLTLGELLILPVGLGLFGRLAPAGMAATVIALWFFASFFGNLFAGGLGVLWSRLPPSVYFLIMGAVAVAASLLLLIFDRPIRRIEADLVQREKEPAA